jgi:hypothetical protein
MVDLKFNFMVAPLPPATQSQKPFSAENSAEKIFGEQQQLSPLVLFYRKGTTVHLAEGIKMIPSVYIS